LQTAAHVQDAVSKGAKLLAGGNRPQLSEPLSSGFFYEPTVLADATADMCALVSSVLVRDTVPKCD
jgi:acyl-CoA reductase-like NAD-dependent aldehyde dehydrogenase